MALSVKRSILNVLKYLKIWSFTTCLSYYERVDVDLFAEFDMLWEHALTNTKHYVNFVIGA